MPDTSNAALADATDAVSDLDEALNVRPDLGDVSTSEIAVHNAIDDYANPWDRLPSEDDFTWNIFCHYRNCGVRRTYTLTVQHVRDTTDRWTDEIAQDSALSMIRAFSAKNRWRERVYAYDQEEERQYQLARSEAIREMADRHSEQIGKAIVGLMSPIEALNHVIDTDPEFIANLSKGNKGKLIDLSIKAARTIPSLMSSERLALGMPTEIVGGAIEHQHIVAVERDRIGEVLAELEAAGVINVGYPGGEPGEIIDAEVVEVHSVPAESDG